ncbi:MAG: ankyrin repeat domain-containing protein [Steroidobacteraceae bacterium]
MGLLPVAALCLAAAPALAGDLMGAARDGDAAQVARLAHSEDVNRREADGTTALMWAVRRNDLASARALLRAGARVDDVNVNAVSALQIACSNGSEALMRLLLDAGASIEKRDGAGETPLMSAVRSGEVQAVRLLVDRGAQVNARETEYRQTALMLAARGEEPRLVDLLLKAGAEVDLQTRIGPEPRFRLPAENTGSKGKGISRGGWPEWGSRPARPGGMTALLYASREGRLEAVRLLLAGGASSEVADANDIRPLVIALTNNQLDVARALIEAGADVNAADWFGRTPLWSAIDVRNQEVNDGARDNGIDRAAALQLIDALLARGADPNSRIRQVTPVRFHVLTLGAFTWVDFTGETPFIRAATSGDVTVMERLLAKGADPRLTTWQGTSALMAAAGINWVVSQTWAEGPEQLLEAVKRCVELGLDVNQKNSMGLQAIHGAANRGSNEIIRFLAAHGAQLDTPDREGRTPLDWAGGVFLATVAPTPKPESIALLQQLLSRRTMPAAVAR